MLTKCPATHVNNNYNEKYKDREVWFTTDNWQFAELLSHMQQQLQWNLQQQFFFAFFCNKKNVMNEDVRWKHIMCQGNSKVNSLWPSDAIWRQEIWDPSQYPKRRLFVRSRKVSRPRDWYFKLYHFEMWQAHRQHCCRSACQISKWSDNSKYKSCGFETWRDLTERRLFGYWDGALGQHWPLPESMLTYHH